MKKANQGWLLLPLLLLGIGLRAETVTIYGHISLAEPGVTVMRAGSSQAEAAVINLPLLGGDTVITGRDGRCEIQSDNGTIVRLDHDSELLLATVLAPSLTSHWKVTTLRLLRGGLYIINNTYNREMAQLQTANAAVKLRRDCRVLLDLSEGGSTGVRMLNGRSSLMYDGGSADGLSEERLGRGQAMVVTGAGRLEPGAKGLGDFLLWNEGIDRHFNELHKGINLLPKPLQRYSPGLVYWAEKWSSIYGEWIWNDLLGYVWRPYDESFTWNRPFIHADWVTIRGRQFLVPAEPWGWAPAYLGTWHWMGKSGWVWIPGDFGNSEPWYLSAGLYRYGFFTLFDWYEWSRGSYGDWFFWNRPEWGLVMPDSHRRITPSPEIKRILRGVSKLPEARRRSELEGEARQRILPGRTARPDLDRPVPAGRGEKAAIGHSIARLDWNPDALWAQRTGVTVEFRPATNEFVCDKLHLSSLTISTQQRVQLQNIAVGSDRMGRGDHPLVTSDGIRSDPVAVGEPGLTRDRNMERAGPDQGGKKDGKDGH
jgi:hypothetical protein